MSSTALLGLVLFGISINKLEKRASTEVIEFPGNTELFSVEKVRLVQRDAGEGQATE